MQCLTLFIIDMAVSDLHEFVEGLTTIYHIRSGKVVGLSPPFLKIGGAIAPPSLPPLEIIGFVFTSSLSLLPLA